MNVIKHLLKLKYKLIVKLDFLRFANGGSSIRDKYNSYLLRSAMDNPFGDRPTLIQKKINRSGNILPLRHRFFNNIGLEFDLLDNFQMAICKEFFLENTYNLTTLNFVPTTIIDCGGYRGYFSFIASNSFKNANIICIEANPDNYCYIKESITVNNLKQINVLNKAVSTIPEIVNLTFDGTNSMIDKNKGSLDCSIKVETINLYELINEDKLLLKVDIEGSELDFFPDIISKLPETCAVFLETHDGWQSLSVIKEEFELNGFTFKIIRERNEFIDSFAQRSIQVN